MSNVDIALQQVKIAEGVLVPTLAAVGNVQKNFGSTQSVAVLETFQASIAAQPSGKPRRRSVSGGSTSTRRATRCRRT
jgi:hypothetical protein